MKPSRPLGVMLGVDVGPPRLPHVALTPGQAGELRRQLEARGFFDWIQQGGRAVTCRSDR